jgi:beta propeller repeat protein
VTAAHQRRLRSSVPGTLAIALILPAACSDDADGGMDAGADTDSDADTDTDSDTGSDPGTDTDTMPEGFVADAGPWVWEDLPDAGDCGAEGCRQLTFTEGVRQLEWDVGDDLLVYNDGETLAVSVVDYAEKRYLNLPNAFPDIGIGPSMGSSEYYPATVSGNLVCYSRAVFQDPDFSDAICANLVTETQQLVYHRPKEGADFPNPGEYLDVYGTRIVSMGGCGEVMDSWPLCAFDMDAPGTYQEIAPSYYGYSNQIWGDVAVWASESYDDYDIRGYDFSTGELIEITDDTQAQMNPRIYGTRVVYHDLKLGNSLPAGDWNHAAVFMYDLETKTTTQITSGEWIAADPDIYENIVVWADSRACSNPNDKHDLANVEIWGYNLDTATEFQITDLPGRAKETPRIWGDKVFVHMYKAAGGDAIYMFDLPDGAKLGRVTAPPPSAPRSWRR